MYVARFGLTLDLVTDNGAEYPQDDDFDDRLIPMAGSPSAPASGAAPGVVSFDPNSLAVLSSMNANLARMADSMGKLDSIEQSVTRLAVAFEALTKVLSEKK